MINKLASVVLVVAVLVPSLADAGTRCRTRRSGSTVYTTCEDSGGKTECRSSVTCAMKSSAWIENIGVAKKLMA